jgi:transcriptional regulator with PAS, ATPase and Fis domain
MASTRPAATQIRKLLDSTAEGLYLVDGAGTIVFASPPLAAWVGISVDELVGQSCRYHTESASSPAVSIAARLCPPPTVFAGERVTTTIVLPRDNQTHEERHVEYIPLNGETGDVVLIIARLLPSAGAHSPGRASTSDVEPLPSDWHVALDRHRQLIAHRYRLDHLVGNSLAARRTRAQVALAASSQGNVLIVGPSGSGRQHLARAIHHAPHESPHNTLLPLACPLLGLDVLTSSLHAVARPHAATEPLATLLLLEVDQLSAECQAALAESLRVESPAYRVLATARTSLLTLAARGDFSRELAMVIATLVIELPTLSERNEDVPLLAQAALEHANRESAKQLGGFSPEALDRLATYAWPGNIDELVDTVTAAHSTATGPVITLGDLPPRLEFAAQAVARPRKSDDRIVLPEFLAQIERELIARALRRTKGNKAKAARLLGMTRPRLYRRMVQLGLANESP